MANINTKPESDSSAIDPKTIIIRTTKARTPIDILDNDIPKKIPADKSGREISNPLVKQLNDAVKAGDIYDEFTPHSVRQWMSKFNIRKGDGTPYKEGYAANILYNSVIKDKKTKNRNRKCMLRRKNKDGIYLYRLAV